MASSSSPSPSAPALSSHSWKYQVFLSFRGEDTRNTFVSHLYPALEQECIFTYKDDETLPRGESIHPALMKAIEQSRIAVVIFSKNYGDSSWCLDELAHIMKCRDTIGQIVMPIFYDVSPSEVRKQKWKYEEAFAKHELVNKTKVDVWRKALVDASNIAGWETRNIANGDEAKGIKKIVIEISQKLNLVTPRENENLIGMLPRLKRLKSDLQIGSAGVRMVGIWGIGGGGKTTLASSVFEEICRQFDGCCFVQNIREESSRYGLGKLEADILSKIGVNSFGGGRCTIKDRLCHRKVLIVLDDANHLDQLKALAGSHDWFGDGSRIIITTRDVHLLNAHRVDVIHNICLLNDDDAIKLFCKHAFLDYRPMEDYKQLTKEVVTYAGGLPLALTVLGSFLCDKDIDEWKSALARLKKIPDTDILEKLKISFDGLKPLEKQLFLDIACFFRWRSRDEAMKILIDCDFHPVIGIKVLIQKALITISEYGRFDMHDLVQEMGHYIVRGLYPNNPEKHSRIWKNEDVRKICAMDSTTELDMIEAIRFQEDSLSPHLPPIVANTKNLRWIDWDGDFESHLLSNFPQSTLCHLRLCSSLQKQLWVGRKIVPNLKTMELWDFPNLNMTPNFDGLRNLDTLILIGCPHLEEVHPSIGCLERLVYLVIDVCPRLKMFPLITHLTKLETLSFEGCRQLFKLTENQQQNMERLAPLHFDNSWREVVSYIESISPNFFINCWRCGCINLSGVECCLEEPCLPHNNMKPCLHDSMNHLGLLSFLKELRILNLSKCNLGDEEISSALWELPNLKKLNLAENRFSRLSFNILRFPRLKWLNVSFNKDLVELSELPSSIAVVHANGCRSLESFGDILLDSMLQGNATEDYFIQITLTYQIPKGFVGRLFRGSAFTLRLPDDWYNDFCGFLICVVTKSYYSDIHIVIQQEADEDSLFELWQDPNEAGEPDYDERLTTCVGYVSFGSLRHTAFSNSLYTLISVSLEELGWAGIELIPRKSKGDQPQTTKVATDSSEFFHEKRDYIPRPFTMQHDSKSSIKIKWRPYYTNVLTTSW